MNKRIKHTIIGALIIAAVYLVFNILISTGVIAVYDTLVLRKIFIDIILALGLNLITGITGQFSLGHAGFMSVGAYTAALIASSMSNVNVLSVLLICVAGTIAGGIFGFLIGVPVLRLKGDYLAIATLGFAEIIRIIITGVPQNVFGGSVGLTVTPFINFEWVFFVMVLTFIISRNFIKSSYGRACISVREDEVAAEAMGINLSKTKIRVFIIGTALAGLAGALYVGNLGFIQPKDFGLMKSIDILMIVVIGGLGNIWGTIVAAFFMNILSTSMGQLTEMLTQAAGKDLSALRMVIYALILIAVMLVKSGESKFFASNRRGLEKMMAYLKRLPKKVLKLKK